MSTTREALDRCTAGSTLLWASRVYFWRIACVAVCMLFAGTSALAFDSAPYSPLPNNGQWTYLRNSSERIVETVLGTRSINGIPVTVVGTSYGEESYSIVNANGTFSYGGTINSDGTLATYTPNAPMKLLDADAALGVGVNNSGLITLNIPELGSFPFQYTLTTTPQAFETITVPAGRFETLRIFSVLRMYGTVSGPAGSVLLDMTLTTTSWQASGIGAIKTVTQTTSDNQPPITDTLELTTLNFLPVLSFSSTSADWGSQSANGLPGNVLRGTTITNDSPFTIQLNTAISGEFALASGGDCTVLAPGQYCFINADFRPSSVGEKTGALTITSDAIGSPFIHPLRGIGVGVGIATLTPNTLDFGNQDRGITSAAKSVTITNIGSASLTIAFIQTTGQYEQTNNCGASIAVGGQCQVNITFRPFGTGVVTGSVIIDTLSDRFFVSLSGNGIGAAPPASISSPRLSFGSQQVGTTSSTQSFALKNEGTSHLNIYSIGPDQAHSLGDFSFETDCPAVLPAGASCYGNVRFVPTATGSRYGYISINTDGVPSGAFMLVFSGIGASHPVDTVPDPFSFATKTGVMLNLLVASEPVVVTGIDAETAISISGGSYRIDGGFYEEQPSTVLPGQSVVVYVNSGGIPSKTREAALTIGGVQANFRVSTAASGLPNAPSEVAALGGNSWGWISFTPPSASGGFPIINYEASCAPVSGGATVSVIRGIADVSPLQIFPLLNDISYVCSVRAYNAAGAGPFSPPSNPITPRADSGPTPILLTIAGPDTVSEEGGATFSATVTFNDTTMQTVTPVWSVTGTRYAITATGQLNANPVSCDQRLVLRATYAFGIELRAEKALTVNASGGGAPSCAVNLIPGWNLLGNGLAAPLDVAAAFGDAAKVTTVWKWVKPKNNWAFFAPGENDAGAAYAANNGYDHLTQIGTGEGFWVNAKSDFTAQLPAATVVSASHFQTLGPAWNLIASGDGKTPSQFSQLLNELLPTPAVGTLWAWDSFGRNWFFHAPSLETNGTLHDYILTNGYLNFGSRILHPTTGIWVNLQ